MERGRSFVARTSVRTALLICGAEWSSTAAANSFGIAGGTFEASPSAASTSTWKASSKYHDDEYGDENNNTAAVKNNNKVHPRLEDDYEYTNNIMTLESLIMKAAPAAFKDAIKITEWITPPTSHQEVTASKKQVNE